MRRTRILITLMCLASTVALTRAHARADSAQDNYTAYSAKCQSSLVSLTLLYNV